mgnify:CR=1 FL=1|tara:strand:- start:11352 stop:13097 length:1746 start_codon:yes stop_codon:yes gene_type:complete
MGNDNQQKSFFYQVFYLLYGHYFKLFFITLLFLISSIFDIISLSSIGLYTSFIFTEESSDNLKYIAFINNNLIEILKKDNYLLLNILIVMLFIIKFGFIIIIQNIIITFSYNRQTEIRDKLVNSFTYLPYSNFILRDTSEYIVAAGEYTASFGSVISNILKLASEGLVFIFIMIFLYNINGSILIYLLIIFGIVILIFRIFFKQKLNIYGQLTAEGSREMFQGINEFFYGFKELKILQNYSYFQKNIMNGALKFANNNRKAQLINILPRYTLEVAIVLFVVTVAYFSDDIIGIIPTITIFIVAAVRLMPSVSVFIVSINYLIFSKYATSKIFSEIRNINNLKAKYKDEYNIKNQKKSEFLRFDMTNVSFTYSGTSKKILNEVNLHFKKGDFVGIIGGSGEGKTTLIDIILYLLEPDHGKISVNGKDINQNNLINWRSKTAYLPQDVFLINNTIESNIALGVKSEEIDRDRYNYAIQKSRIYNLIDSLAFKDKTIVGERGIKLSGGQKQRIAIARALYLERDILIFDESTNALDELNEKNIIDHISSFQGEKTLLLISHKPSLLNHCNKIFEIKNNNLIKIK